MWLKNIFSGQARQTHSDTNELIAKPDQLILYKFDSCPFCVRVMRVIDAHDLPVTYRDTRQDPNARQDLIQLTGRTQVPCLVIDGKPMLESRDIVRYLQKVFDLN